MLAILKSRKYKTLGSSLEQGSHTPWPQNALKPHHRGFGRGRWGPTGSQFAFRMVLQIHRLTSKHLTQPKTLRTALTSSQATLAGVSPIC